MQRKKEEEKYIIIIFFISPWTCLFPASIPMVRIDTQGECLRLGLKSRESRCLPSPWSGGSVEGGLEQRFRFRIQCLVYSYLTKMKGDTIPFPWSMSTATFTHCFRPTRTQTKRPSVHMRTVFLLPDSTNKGSSSLDNDLDSKLLCASDGGGSWRKWFVRTLYFFYCEMETFKPFSSTDYKNSSFYKNFQTVSCIESKRAYVAIQLDLYRRMQEVFVRENTGVFVHWIDRLN